MQNWLVIRTRPRWEKKVAKLLQDKGIETYCPLVKTRRQWSDRVKTIDMPLLKCLLFVRIAEEQRTLVRLTEGVVNFVHKEGKPVMMREKGLQQIRLFQQLHPVLTATESTQLVNGNGLPAGVHKAATLCIDNLNIILVAGSGQPAVLNASPDKI